MLFIKYLLMIGGVGMIALAGAIFAYDPSRGLSRRGPAGGET